MACNTPLVIYLGNLADPITWIGSPRIVQSRQPGQTQLSFQMRERGPLAWQQLERARVRVTTATGEELFKGNILKRDWDNLPPRVTSLSASGYTHHLRRQQLKKPYAAPLSIALAQMIADADADGFIDLGIFLTGSVDLEGEPIAVKNYPIDYDMAGKFLDEALALALTGLADWYLDPATQLLTISDGSVTSSAAGGIDIQALNRGCAGTLKPRNLRVNYTPPMINKVTVARDLFSLTNPTAGEIIRTVPIDFGANSDDQFFRLLPTTTRVIAAIIKPRAVAPAGCSVGDYTITGTNFTAADPTYDDLPSIPASAPSAAEVISTVEIGTVETNSVVYVNIKGSIGTTKPVLTVKVGDDTIETYTLQSADIDVPRIYALTDYIDETVTVEVKVTLAAQSGTPTEVALDAVAGCCVITSLAGDTDFSHDLTPAEGIVATQANLNTCKSLAYYDGAIYFLDTSDNKLYSVTLADGILHHIAGTGSSTISGDGGSALSAGLGSSLSGLAIDTSGNIYLADNGFGDYIRKIDAVSGNISAFAGQNGSSGYTGDGGAATSATLNGPGGMAVYDGSLYFADTNNSVFRAVNLTSNIITTIAGNGNFEYGAEGIDALAGGFTIPRDICFDSAGNKYLLEQYRVRKVNASDNKINTYAGTGVSGNGGDGGPATSGTFNLSFGIDITPDGSKLFITDNANGYVRVVTAADGEINRYAGVGNTFFEGYGDGYPPLRGLVDAANDVLVDPDGGVYISHSSVVRRVLCDEALEIIYYIDTYAGDGTQGYSGDGGAATSAQLKGPAAVAVLPDGDLVIADAFNYALRRVDSSTRNISTIIGTGTRASVPPTFGTAAAGQLIGECYGVATDADGNIYFSDINFGYVAKIDTSGIITEVASLSGGPQLAGVALDSNNDVYVCSLAREVVYKLSGGTATAYAGTVNSAGFSGDGGAATSAQLDSPYQIAFDDYDNLFIVDYSNFRLRRVDGATGTISTYAGNGTLDNTGDGGLATDAGFSTLSGVAIGDGGHVYVYDCVLPSIRKIDKSTNIITRFAGNKIPGFSGDGGNALLAKINGQFSFGGGLGYGNRALYIADENNHRIRRVTR